MKNSGRISSFAFMFLILGLSALSVSMAGQDAPVSSPPLADSINKIVAVSCMPCHSNTGGVFSKSKLNFDNWTRYSPEKQRERALKMYAELSKGAMPPKAAREKNPEKIPTKEQLAVIKRWSESFKATGQ